MGLSWGVDIILGEEAETLLQILFKYNLKIEKK